MSDARHALGKSGEDSVARWYVARGWSVVARNFRCRYGEIDLIVARRGELVFCEVKARRGQSFGDAFEKVDYRRQGRLRRAAVHWLSLEPRGAANIRFDVAAVRDGVIEVLEGAF